jgi:hypothetical protein
MGTTDELKLNITAIKATGIDLIDITRTTIQRIKYCQLPVPSEQRYLGIFAVKYSDMNIKMKEDMVHPFSTHRGTHT